MKRLAVLFSSLLAASTAFAQFVDLGEASFYVRTGFEDAWTRVLPGSGDEAWTVVEPTRGQRSLEMRRLGLPGAPSGGMFSFIPAPAMEYTVVVPFEADLTLLNASDPALFLKQVGQQWAVYLNGVLLRSEFVRSGSGYLERSLRDVVVPLDKRRLERGTNILAFRLRGDPVDDRTGFNRTGPYVMDSYRSLAAANREYLDLMLIGVYAFFALYHSVLFALRPKDRGYLYFSGITLLLAVYMASLTNAAAVFVPDTSILRRIEYVSLFLCLPVMLAFLESLLGLKRSRFLVSLAAFSAAISVVGQFVRLEPLLNLWYVAAFAAIAYLPAFTFRQALVRDFRALRAEREASKDAPRPVELIAELLFHRDSGRIVAGAILASVAVIVDIIVVSTGSGSFFWSKYAFFLFILLLSAVLAAQFAKVSARAEAMNAGLEAEVEERTAELSAAASERLRLNGEIASANGRLTEVMEESARDVRLAAAVQRGFFPTKPPMSGEWDLAFAFEPASGVSGDFYDFFESSGSLTGIVAGTVSGSGIASGLVTVLAKNVFNRGMADMDGDSLTSTLVEINRKLVRELSAVGNTVSCTFLRLSGARVEYINASHTDALLRRAGRRDATIVRPKDGLRKAPPLGRDDFETGVSALGFSVAPGDALFVHTGGLTGSVNARKEPYGTERLAQAFGRADPEHAESMLASVLIDFRNFLGGARRSGDITALVLVKR